MRKIKLPFGTIIFWALVLFATYLILHVSIYIFNYYTENNLLYSYPESVIKRVTLDEQRQINQLQPNEIGDSIGGVLNPLIGLTAIFVTFLAFYIQYRANEEVRKQFKLQQFESQFFEMLRLHKENVNEMKIAGYSKIVERSYENGKIAVREIEIMKEVEGRKVFVSMVKELTAAMEFCLRLSPLKYERDDILELSYRIFFFGSESSLVSSNCIVKKDIDKIKAELKLVRGAHKQSLAEINQFKTESGETIKVHIKYSPFTGHESRLGHYYSHLYSTVKYVVKREKEGLFDYNQTRDYLKILRSQMSNHEQLLLYYNYRIGFGKDWDRLGPDDNQLLTRYRMLHNLPVNKVVYAENPRTHFKDFIKSIKDSDDPLFEWGDYET